MTKVSLKGMLGRKLRTALTAFSIVLGVAMVTGAYIVTDTMLAAADKLENASYSNVGAVVAAKQGFKVDENNGFNEPKAIDAGLVDKVRAVDGVDVAAAEINDEANLVDKKGEVIGTEGGPTFAVGYDGTDPKVAALSPFRFKDGGFPSKPNEIAIDAGSAKKEKLGVGDTIQVSTQGPLQTFKIAGIATFGDVQSIGNATAAIFTLGTAQKLFNKEGKVDSILVNGDPGVTAGALKASLNQAMPATVEARSASDQDRFGLDGLSDFLGILQKIMVAFGGVAVFVGAFIIFNTLSITVAQRAREFGLLRMVGAARGQILRSVVLEALVIGFVASVLGIVAGVGLAKALDALFVSFGMELPNAGTVFATRTVVVAFLVGVGVTVVAGLSPALRATRVSPVTAFREGSMSDPAKRGRIAAVVAVVTTLVGAGMTAYGMLGDMEIAGRLSLIGFGVLLLFVGVALFSSRLVRPLASVLGRGAGVWGGAAGRLARENATRNPQRTATTAAALMIGLALVAFVAVLGAGLRSSFGDSLDKQLSASYVVTSKDGWSPFAADSVAAVDKANRGGAVASIKEDQVKAFGDTENIGGVDPQRIGEFLKFNFAEGSLAGLQGTQAIVAKDYAEANDLKVGSPVKATLPSGGTLALTVAAVDERPNFNPLGLPKIMVANDTFEQAFQTRRPRYIFADSGGVDIKELETALKAFPEAQVKTQQGYKEFTEEDLEGFLGFLYILLALSVIVSLFGIVNTLVLSVFERTRELGMLRAIGMTRRQVRRMVRRESIIVALIGATLGMGLGLFLAALVTTALRDEGLTFTFPFGTLIAFAIVAVIAGVVAAILPARRAAKLNVLNALQYE